MMEDLLSKEAEAFFAQSLHSHPIGAFLRQCTNLTRLPWAIEFKCGNCCKKASNVRIMGISGGLLLLAPFDISGIVIELFGEEGVIDTETARFLLIPWDNVCSLEVMAFPTPMGDS
ncbi:MAG: hypothetical protein GX795_01840 [Firmicutes bacterium]|nr:hypothetical protein [Bacillota bacterium]